MAAGKKAKKRGTRKRIVDEEPVAVNETAERRDRDPFRIVGEIPKGRAYQWVTVSVHGDEDIVRDQVEDMKAAGWVTVPAQRHPAMRAVSGRIVSGGMMLVERGQDAVEGALNRARSNARAMLASPRDEPNGDVEIVGVVGNNEKPNEKVQVRWRIDSQNDRFCFAREPRYVPPVTIEPVTVDVTIPVRLSTRLVDAAHVCCLTPEQYATRMLAMVLRGDYDGGYNSRAVLGAADGRTAFEVFDIQMVVKAS